MRKPWFIWLSILAFTFLWWDTTRLLVFTKSKNEDKGSKFELWIRAIGNFTAITVCYIMLPMLLLVIAIDLSGNYSNLLGTIVNAIALICLYFLGVYAAYKHSLWRRKKISHLINNSELTQCEDTQERE